MWRGYALAAVCVNAYFLAVALSNVVYLRRATRPAGVMSGPFVSVIVPARDEEDSIGGCLRSLLEQDYADYEVIVVDDRSADDTRAIVRRLQASEPRLRLVEAGTLPPGWLGKTHALAEGTAASRGEILLLTDADTVHRPSSLSWAVTNLEQHRADLLSGYLRQQYGSFGEKLIVPTMYAMMLLTPLSLIPATRSPQLSFSIGQYVAIRRAALDPVGGFESIRDSIVDDLAMAARVKAFGYRNVFLDAKDAACAHLYSGYRHAFAGIERSVYSAVGASPLAVAAVTAVVLAFIVAPALAVLLSLARLAAPAPAMTAAALLFLGQWGAVAADRDAPFVAVALYPLVFVSLLTILFASMVETGFGSGAEWKGRRVTVPGQRHGRREERPPARGTSSGARP